MAEESDGSGRAKVYVRLASSEDAHALAQLRYAFRSGVGDMNEGESEFVGRCRQWIEARLREGSSWRCWVAKREQKLVGNLWAQLIEKIPNPSLEPEHHAYITNFYVREGERGSGIGSLLLSAALDWCGESDVHAVILWPTERSRSLYLRHGFAVRQDLLELLIGEKGSG